MTDSRSRWSTGGGVKLDRAKELTEELLGQIKEFCSASPIRHSKEIDEADGKEVLRARVLCDVPVRWGTLVGDAVHNLRAVLDLLVWQLVLGNGHRPGRHNYFPISDEEEVFERIYVRVLEGASSATVDTIRSLRPYRDGNRSLWLLHKLDIIDKHRALVPALSWLGATDIDISNDFRRLSPPHIAATIPPMRVSVIRGKPLCPIYDGAELWRSEAGRTEAFDPTFTASITLDPGVAPVDPGEPIAELLPRLIKEVERVVDCFPEATSRPNHT